MRYLALATDYDGTLASEGSVADSTLQALERLRASGRKLIMVTGRHLPDLLSIFTHEELFDRFVVENGAVLYDPATLEEQLLCAPPPEAFLAFLRERNVPFEAGRVIVATSMPHDAVMLEAIRRLRLDLEVIYNKSSVMVLPCGVNKATGLQAVLFSLRLSPQNVVGIGDAENDLPLLAACGCGVATANALPALKAFADVVMEHDNGAGVVELIGQMLEDDLARYDDVPARHSLYRA